MGTLDRKKKEKIATKKISLGITAVFSSFFSVFYIINIIKESSLLISVLLVTLILIVNIYIYFRLFLLISNKLKFKKEDKIIFNLTHAFLNYLEVKQNEKFEILQQLFSVHSKKKLLNFYKKTDSTDINDFSLCKQLLNHQVEIRYYAIYTLFDIASEDRLYSIKKEQFIEKIREQLRIHPETFQHIKNAYLNKGLKEESKLIEEQNRKKAAKKLSKSFLPYNAYKILGVSPTITKAQLKKVYRTLAKKYHPDKYHGQNDEIIQKAEDKFQEILEAYEIIKKYKNYCN